MFSLCFYSLGFLIFQLIGFFAETNFYLSFSYLFIGMSLLLLFSLKFNTWYSDLKTFTTQKSSPALNLTFLILVVSHLIGLFRPFIFENDYYRYFIDGLHFLKSIPVYQTTPIASPLKFQFPEVFGSVGFPEVGTVYPPFTIAYFALLVFLSGSQFFLFKYLLRAVAVIILTFISWLLVKNKISLLKHRVLFILIFLSHPFLYNELIINVHFDVLLVALCAILILQESPTALSFFAWAGAFKTIVAIPAVFYVNKFKEIRGQLRSLLVLIAMTLASVLFFRKDIYYYFSNLSYASLHWEMNSGVFRWIRHFLSYKIEDYDKLIRVSQWVSLATFFLFGAIVKRISVKRNFSFSETLFYYLFSLPLFTPVCNPWYFTWGLPLLFTETGSSKRKKILLCAYVPIFMYYLFFILNTGFTQEPGIWLDIEHILVFAFLFLGLQIK